MDDDQLEYGVYEQCEQKTEREAPAIRSPALPNEQWSSGGVYARDLARNAPLDHPERLAEKGQSPQRSAAREAFEEAGVLGAIGRQPVGSFSYEKRLKDGGSVECEVRVFPLEVKRQRKEWPEKQERRIKWLSASKAAARVKHPDLSKIIRRVARRYA
jgi:8-oxo-dGTP pyrophosphatase MutT (NUDIX family)